MSLLISGVLGLFGALKIPKIGVCLSLITFAICAYLPKSELSVNWFMLDNICVDFSLISNLLNLLICSIVCSILLCLYFAAHLYSNDNFIIRKLSVLNIFVFFMSITVVSGNIFQFFIGIEALGIISAILIGIECNTSKESTRVFLCNKFASFLFFIAVCILGLNAGSFEFEDIKKLYASAEGSELLIPSVMLLVACLCKGAQFPFSFWLFDAVKANIFVSILIHTATIVGIGILFVTKCFFIFDKFQCLKDGMIFIGLLTAFLMACHAFLHDNIKKIVACLTIVSIGLMFVACGMGMTSAAILYFVCHAFFKASFFLVFAYVISSMHGELNMSKMAGLCKRAKYLLWVSFGIAAGLPFCPGFFAKIAFAGALQNYASDGVILANTMLSVLTTASMFRMVCISSQESSDYLKSLPSSSKGYSFPVYPIVLLMTFALLGGFLFWNMYCRGELLFDSDGYAIAPTKRSCNYLSESFEVLIHLLISIVVGLLCVIYPKTLHNLSKINILLNRGSRLVKNIVILAFSSICSVNQKIFDEAQRSLVSLLDRIQKYLHTKHKKVATSHVRWIVVGVMLNLVSILFAACFP
jgi:NADH:ubiquinone oxidoreductase subunit 5 (subunit L)/multisubunit Na+/H+ antiporter MnhA subunit